ncbi:MAG: prolipoprotein diacylglyceryl transferase [Candidatus Margulisbacteria bacterium GWF2_35_9]|nr:MAG: prolipoprotein diacylglyceryl transferase [Candidatus Margulisbacteria bacterium GWF2_35_9]
MEHFFNFWQNIPYNINPIAFEIFGLQFRWYSIMYLIGIMVVYTSIIRILKKNPEFNPSGFVLDLFNYCVFGIILGARLGYAFFYQPGYYIHHLPQIFWPFENGVFVGISGLSYHGGAIGFILALFWVTHRYKLNTFNFLNLIVAFIPLGYTFGRLGNFLNLELYGRLTTSVWGMYFPSDSLNLLRVPSQLLEAFGEGLLLFILLVYLRRFFVTKKILTPIYIIGYGVVRFFIEFLREPDSFQNLVFNVLSYGQIFSILMIFLGLILIPIFNKQCEK